MIVLMMKSRGERGKLPFSLPYLREEWNNLQETLSEEGEGAGG
jgi:hypothetical protein